MIDNGYVEVASIYTYVYILASNMHAALTLNLYYYCSNLRTSLQGYIYSRNFARQCNVIIN
jgi:hypothetical protein